MIIWLNGPFGGGKSTVTRELLASWPDLLLFDPEFLGDPARHYSPERVADWQDLPVWRDLTVAAADGLLRAYQRPLVVPMTLLREEYAVEIFDRLDVLSWPVFHLVLDAPEAVIRQRIESSDEGGPAAEGVAEVRSWRLGHLGAYEEALTSWLGDAATVLPTAGRAPKQIAEDIVALVRAGDIEDGPDGELSGAHPRGGDTASLNGQHHHDGHHHDGHRHGGHQAGDGRLGGWASS